MRQRSTPPREAISERSATKPSRLCADGWPAFVSPGVAIASIAKRSRSHWPTCERVPAPDDPADSRGILSWHAQPHDGRLYEAGSYGQLLRVPLPDGALAAAERAGAVIVRLEVDEALPGGLAIYGARFGRYPVDPTVLFVLR